LGEGLIPLLSCAFQGKPTYFSHEKEKGLSSWKRSNKALEFVVYFTPYMAGKKHRKSVSLGEELRGLTREAAVRGMLYSGMSHIGEKRGGIQLLVIDYERKREVVE